MLRYDLMIANRVIKEYRPMNWRARRRYSRRIDHALRYVCPTFPVWETLEAAFWFILAGACIAAVIAFPVLFVRWWMCM